MQSVAKGGAPAPDESVRIFKSDALEALTHMHPATPWVLGVPTIALMAWWALLRAGLGPWPFVGFALAGVLLWTLVEYVLHRFVFHYEPRTSWGRWVHFLAHGVHHDYPNDASRLVMPPVLSVPVGALLFFGLWWLLGVPAAPAVFCGVMVGYMAYDTLHFMAHHRPMRGPVGRFLKRYHMRHHFADPQTGYGVSSPLWDYVFRTHVKRGRRDSGSRR